MTRHIDIEAQFIIPGKNHFVFYPKDSKFIYDFDADDSKITIAKADGTAMDAGAITTFSSYNILQNIGNAKSPQYGMATSKAQLPTTFIGEVIQLGSPRGLNGIRWSSLRALEHIRIRIISLSTDVASTLVIEDNLFTRPRPFPADLNFSGEYLNVFYPTALG
eukprot:GHVT01038545.1.p1 GENE.GHVT01038545.1~~GHVT01038545.1.p1  ORF type:complete len:163 (-),score=4.86 GHVT01038545.1:724-1212(-)